MRRRNPKRPADKYVTSKTGGKQPKFGIHFNPELYGIETEEHEASESEREARAEEKFEFNSKAEREESETEIEIKSTKPTFNPKAEKENSDSEMVEEKTEKRVRNPKTEKKESNAKVQKIKSKKSSKPDPKAEIEESELVESEANSAEAEIAVIDLPKTLKKSNAVNHSTTAKITKEVESKTEVSPIPREELVKFINSISHRSIDAVDFLSRAPEYQAACTQPIEFKKTRSSKTTFPIHTKIVFLSSHVKFTYLPLFFAIENAIDKAIIFKLFELTTPSLIKSFARGKNQRFTTLWHMIFQSPFINRKPQEAEVLEYFLNIATTEAALPEAMQILPSLMQPDADGHPPIVTAMKLGSEEAALKLLTHLRPKLEGNQVLLNKLLALALNPAFIKFDCIDLLLEMGADISQIKFSLKDLESSITSQYFTKNLYKALHFLKNNQLEIYDIDLLFSPSISQSNGIGAYIVTQFCHNVDEEQWERLEEIMLASIHKQGPYILETLDLIQTCLIINPYQKLKYDDWQSLTHLVVKNNHPIVNELCKRGLNLHYVPSMESIAQSEIETKHVPNYASSSYLARTQRSFHHLIAIHEKPTLHHYLDECKRNDVDIFDRTPAHLAALSSVSAFTFAVKLENASLLDVFGFSPIEYAQMHEDLNLRQEMLAHVLPFYGQMRDFLSAGAPLKLPRVLAEIVADCMGLNTKLLDATDYLLIKWNSSFKELGFANHYPEETFHNWNYYVRREMFYITRIGDSHLDIDLEQKATNLPLQIKDRINTKIRECKERTGYKGTIRLSTQLEEKIQLDAEEDRIAQSCEMYIGNMAAAQPGKAKPIEEKNIPLIASLLREESKLEQKPRKKAGSKKYFSFNRTLSFESDAPVEEIKEEKSASLKKSTKQKPKNKSTRRSKKAERSLSSIRQDGVRKTSTVTNPYDLDLLTTYNGGLDEEPAIGLLQNQSFTDDSLDWLVPNSAQSRTQQSSSSSSSSSISTQNTRQPNLLNEHSHSSSSHYSIFSSSYIPATGLLKPHSLPSLVPLIDLTEESLFDEISSSSSNSKTSVPSKKNSLYDLSMFQTSSPNEEEAEEIEDAIDISHRLTGFYLGGQTKPSLRSELTPYINEIRSVSSVNKIQPILKKIQNKLAESSSPSALYNAAKRYGIYDVLVTYLEKTIKELEQKRGLAFSS